MEGPMSRVRVIDHSLGSIMDCETWPPVLSASAREDRQCLPLRRRYVVGAER